MLPYKYLETCLRTAVKSVIPELSHDQIQLRPCPNPSFGDYQCASLIGLAKSRKINPRQLAGQVEEAFADVVKKSASPLADKFTHTIDGPGFFNFRLRPEGVTVALQEALEGGPLFYEKSDVPRTVVLDFSSPNIAKPMHVGHIRSTILGDCLARALRLLGHHVITDNHLGDWGTQFGKLILGWKQAADARALEEDPVGELERLYKTTNAACEADPVMLEAARVELVRLQNGDPENLRIWQQMLDLSRDQFQHIYDRLGVHFDHALGESFYNPRLKDVVEELAGCGLAQPSEGAMVVYFEEDPQLKAHPAIVRKSDGGFNYTTTDLATLEYRLKTWNPSEIIYVTDGRQQLHFRQLFAIFRRWHSEAEVTLSHIWFGSILGEDGKPFKARSGETIRLRDLLDEAEQRAYAVVAEKNPALGEEEKREIARIVGMGAVKYADLLPNRQTDYVFSWDKCLSFNGNTAPYLLYAYTRIRSIFRKQGKDELPASEFTLEKPEEIHLAKHLLNFGFVLEAVAAEYRPNYLCNYLYELAGHFTRFYENCPVLKAPTALRWSRLALCDLTSRVLRQGLAVLGIETTEKM